MPAPTALAALRESLDACRRELAFVRRQRLTYWAGVCERRERDLLWLVAERESTERPREPAGVSP